MIFVAQNEIAAFSDESKVGAGSYINPATVVSEFAAYKLNRKWRYRDNFSVARGSESNCAVRSVESDGRRTCGIGNC